MQVAGCKRNMQEKPQRSGTALFDRNAQKIEAGIVTKDSTDTPWNLWYNKKNL